MSIPYSSNQPPAGLQPANLPVQDADTFILQRSGDNIVRGVAASSLKSYIGAGGGCNEPMVTVAAQVDRSQYSATLNWSAGCAFVVTCDMTGQSGSGNPLTLNYENLPAAGILAERNIFVVINNASGAYLNSVTDTLGGSAGTYVYPGVNGGIAALRVLMPGTLWPYPLYTFAEAFSS